MDQGRDNGQGIRYTTHDFTGSSNAECSLARVQPPIGACLHSTSGTNSRRILQGLDGSNVSVHTLIERDGTRDELYSPDLVTFHTGSTWFLLPKSTRCDPANEVLLGIEMECLDTQAPTWQQLDSTAEQIVLWAKRYGWRWPYLIYGHYGIAIPLGRRSDPVRTQWGALMGFLYARSKEQSIGGL